ncbi:MAG: GNAT family N-acetyltransferase [Ruminococcaceae bacterium]|nr:GNAT family N-acetyltransferase [Oscillospiraceae bacterium]
MEYTFRLAVAADRAAVIGFIRQHWGAPHPLVELPDFFDYYYKAEESALRFALAEADGRIVAAAGYVPASRGPAADVWVSLWVADPAARGSGLELMDALPALTGCRTLACNNIRPETRPFYEFLGHTTGRVGHFYRLANRPEYRLAAVENKTMPPVGGQAVLTPLPTAEALLACEFVPPRGANPYKDIWYIRRRYFDFPRQQYRLYAAALPGDTAPRALLATRLTAATTDAWLSRRVYYADTPSVVLRMVDYIGPAGFLPQLGAGMDALLQSTAAEYAEFYCAGLPAQLLRQAGFAERTEGSPDILPTYLTPLARENTDFYYFTSRPDAFTLFRADGDQDRPHIPL